MASPIREEVTVRLFAGGTDHNAALGATVNNGDRILAKVTCTNPATTVTTPGGWNSIASLRTTGGSGDNGSSEQWFYRDCDGTEDGASYNWVTSAAKDTIVAYIRYRAGTVHADAPGGTVANDQATADPPSHSFGFTDDVQVIGSWSQWDGTASGGSAPASYSGYSSGDTTSGNQVSEAVAFRDLTAASSENPGAFTTVESADFCVATLVVRGAPILDIPITVNADDNQDDSSTFSTGFTTGLLGFAFTVNQHLVLAWSDGVDVPPGSIIDVAYVTFVADDVGSFVAGSVLSDIFGVDEDDHVPPTTHAQWSTDHGLHTTATTVWDFTAQASGSLQTPSIVGIIQEIIDRAGWASGNRIGLHIDDGGTVSACQEVAYNEHATLASPILHIEFTPPSNVDLYPTADGTDTDVVDEGDATTDLYASIDDDPASPSDSDWNNNTDDAGQAFYQLTDMPADFDVAVSATITVRYRGAAYDGSGTVTLYARLYQSDESTVLSDEVQVAQVTADGSFANTSAVTLTGIVAGTKTTWDGARLRLRWART